MTNQELQGLVEQISLTSFNQPFRNRAVFNSRLRTTGGRFMLNDQHLDFNPRLFAQADGAVQAGIIKHELCHYHLYRAHRGYRHRDADFKHLLHQVGGLRFAPTLTQIQPRYVYVCERCGQTYPRQRQINLRKYRCGRCRGKLYLQSSQRPL